MDYGLGFYINDIKCCLDTLRLGKFNYELLCDRIIANVNYIKEIKATKNYDLDC